MADTALIVFGGTGDLTQRKLYPSLYHLAQRGLLPKAFSLYGVSRKQLTDNEFRANIERDIRMFAHGKIDQKAVDLVTSRAHYLSADLNHKEGYERLEARLKPSTLRIFYLALPPRLFAPIVEHIRACGLGKKLGASRSRVIVEKPFGYDFTTAKKLEHIVSSAFSERQIFRIDHYLGKESVQNLLTYRRAHHAFEHSLDAGRVGAIRVDALEPGGLEARGPYYDGAGSIRDMTQNHLLQLVAFMTMDLPRSLNAVQIRKARATLIKKVRPFRNRVDLTIGQYGGYHAEPGVEKDSRTDTYSSVVFEVNSPRWKGVPIYVRTGKRLTRKLTAVTVEYKPKMGPKQVFRLDEHVAGAMGDYERLLLAVMKGDQSLFVSADEVLSSWKAVGPFLKAAKTVKPTVYRKGSMGP